MNKPQKMIVIKYDEDEICCGNANDAYNYGWDTGKSEGYNQAYDRYETWLKEVANIYQLTVIIRDTIVNEYNGCVDIDSDVTKLAKAVYNILNSKNENSNKEVS